MFAAITRVASSGYANPLQTFTNWGCALPDYIYTGRDRMHTPTGNTAAMLIPHIRTYLSQLYRGWFAAHGTHARLTPKRIGVMLALTLLFPLIEAANWLGFALDSLFFPRWRQASLEAPLFVIGNPRSGTTLLHRLLMRDADTFCVMETWETLLAPSVTQRVVFRALARLDRLVGRPLGRLIAAIERGVQRGIPMHGVGIRQPEEDEGLLVHLWAGLMPWGFFPDPELPPAARFDQELPRDQQDRVMRFYRDCLLRHAHARTHGRHYLAKSPAFSGKVAALLRHIPDARCVVLVRSPLEQVPSELSFRSFIWHRFADPLERYPLIEPVLAKIDHWYRHPIAVLRARPLATWLEITYDELTADPEAAIRRIYQRFGLELSPAYAETLARLSRRAQGYRSQHRYTLEQVGLSRETVVARYADVFAAYGFDTGAPAFALDEDHAATLVRRQRGRRVARRAARLRRRALAAKHSRRRARVARHAHPSRTP